MDWQTNIKKKYAIEGWEALRPADEAFKQRLEQFFAERGLSIVDDNPEGQDWIFLLKDGTELYVDRRLYSLKDPQINLLIDYSPEHGIIAKFFDARGRLYKHEIIVPNNEISAVSDNW